MKIMLLQGPNLNFLGIREKNIYGTNTYNDICEEIKRIASENGVKVECVQTNIEGEMVNYIQKSHLESYDGVIINPGAYTHYSYAIYDAIKSTTVPFVEVHLSNIHTREQFREKSVTAPACIGQISGFGFEGYKMALNYLIDNYRQ